MSEKSLFEKPITELMEENLKKTPFAPRVQESSGLSDELTEEDIKEYLYTSPDDYCIEAGHSKHSKRT